MDATNLRRSLEEVNREIEELKEQLSKKESIKYLLDMMISGNLPSINDLRSRLPQSIPKADVIIQGPPPVVVEAKASSRADRIEEIIRKVGHPLRTNEILERLIEMGDGIEADRHDFWRTIDSVLRKNEGKRFERVGGLGDATWINIDMKIQ